MARSVQECFTLLGIEQPRVVGKNQDEVDTKLQEWKDMVLKKAYREKAKETHPDTNPGDDAAKARFQAVQESYERLDELKISLKVPDHLCPKGHERVPKLAKYCHECGYCFVEDPLVARLKANGVVDRTIEHIKANGEFEKLRKLNPFSPELRQAIELLYHRQRLGLLGPHSGWP